MAASRHSRRGISGPAEVDSAVNPCSLRSFLFHSGHWCSRARDDPSLFWLRGRSRSTADASRTQVSPDELDDPVRRSSLRQSLACFNLEMPQVLRQKATWRESLRHYGVVSTYGSDPPADRLVADSEREPVLESLRRGFADGRLTQPEFEQRLAQAMSVRT